MEEIFLHGLIDSLKVLGFSLIIYILLSFFEAKIAGVFTKHKKVSPLIVSGSALIPQCGISIVAADLYHKNSITLGTLLAVFFACSDEALPILFSDFSKTIYIIPLLLIKFIFGFILGYLVDFIIKKRELKAIEEDVHVGCCNHHIDDKTEDKIHKHFIHPVMHSLKIFVYVFIINVLFGLLIYYIGEDKIELFLESNYYLGPIFACLVGLIPNCASSVITTEMFLIGGLSFGGLVTGLCVNSGLGIVYLLKFKEKRIEVVRILGILILYSLTIGYLTMLIMELI